VQQSWAARLVAPLAVGIAVGGALWLGRPSQLASLGVLLLLGWLSLVPAHPAAFRLGGSVPPHPTSEEPLHGAARRGGARGPGSNQRAARRCRPGARGASRELRSGGTAAPGHWPVFGTLPLPGRFAALQTLTMPFLVSLASRGRVLPVRSSAGGAVNRRAEKLAGQLIAGLWGAYS
jgi:hypothetical protein